jgi:hypothetical protein
MELLREKSYGFSFDASIIMGSWRLLGYSRLIALLVSALRESGGHCRRTRLAFAGVKVVWLHRPEV